MTTINNPFTDPRAAAYYNIAIKMAAYYLENPTEEQKAEYAKSETENWIVRMRKLVRQVSWKH